MELAIPEGPLGGDDTAGDRRAVLDDPLLAPLPGVHVLAVEQDDGVGGRAAVLAGGDLWGLLPGNPALVGLHGRVLRGLALAPAERPLYQAEEQHQGPERQ